MLTRTENGKLLHKTANTIGADWATKGETNNDTRYKQPPSCTMASLPIQTIY